MEKVPLWPTANFFRKYFHCLDSMAMGGTLHHGRRIVPIGLRYLVIAAKLRKIWLTSTILQELVASPSLEGSSSIPFRQKDVELSTLPSLVGHPNPIELIAFGGPRPRMLCPTQKEWENTRALSVSKCPSEMTGSLRIFQPSSSLCWSFSPAPQAFLHHFPSDLPPLPSQPAPAPQALLVPPQSLGSLESPWSGENRSHRGHRHHEEEPKNHHCFTRNQQMSSKYVEMCIVRIQKESPVLSILITNIYSIRTLVALVGGFPSEKNARHWKITRSMKPLTRSSAISPTDLHDISIFVLVQAPWFTVNSMIFHICWSNTRHFTVISSYIILFF